MLWLFFTFVQCFVGKLPKNKKRDNQRSSTHIMDCPMRSTIQIDFCRCFKYVSLLSLVTTQSCHWWDLLQLGHYSETWNTLMTIVCQCNYPQPWPFLDLLPAFWLPWSIVFKQASSYMLFSTGWCCSPSRFCQVGRLITWSNGTSMWSMQCVACKWSRQWLERPETCTFFTGFKFVSSKLQCLRSLEHSACCVFYFLLDYR